MMERKMMSLVVLALLASGFAAAAWTAVDTFDGYANGAVNTVANPPWTEVANTGYSPAAIINGGALTIKPDGAKTPNLLNDPANTVYTSISPIANTDTATTLFVRFRADAGTTNTSFGLSKMGTVFTTNNFDFNNFQNQIRVNSAAGVPTFNVRDSRVTGSFSAPYALTIGQWYNVWSVVNQSTDKVDYYLTTGLNDATNPANVLYSVLQANFRVASTVDLVAFMAMSQGSKSLENNNQLTFDEIYLSSGTELTIPEPATMLLLGLGGLVMSFRKR